MAIIKCKMCGGDLKITEGLTVAECEYCGSKQTIPNVDDEKKLVLFERAERLRRNCEFDKAAGVYESIVADFRTEAEAYWGLVLCKYGIEYVDDPATGKKVPTCHRSSFDSVMDDVNFEQALENTDAVARRVYRDEAKAIEELRKAIIEVSSTEEPYDIFINYKETDDNGDRTLDSVIAQDIYDALCDKGYRVFFSRITLEDKLGTEYEPYIFAALNSAKVMISVGTDYEHFNAVWVKNEWGRFLQLMTQDKTKHLIPCFKNIDAYDMPKEFSKFTAQDMGKIGAMQDLVRGVEKILGEKKSPVQRAAAEHSLADAMVMRGQFALDDGDFAKAEEFFERALDSEPQNGEAYIGKLLVGLKLQCLDQVAGCDVDLDEIKDFVRALKFSSPERRQELCDIQAQVKRKIEINKLYSVLRKLQRKREKEAYLEKIAREKETQRREIEQAVPVIRRHLAPAQRLISAKSGHTLAIMLDGRVMAVGNNESDQCNVSDWQDIVGVSAGPKFSLGLKSDGTVVAAGDNYYGQCDVDGWQKISAISAGSGYSLGLKSDGTVVAVGNNKYGQCDVSAWTDIVAISAGYYHAVGLKSDGTVVAAGFNRSGQCDVNDWTDIVAISTGGTHTVGLKSGGTVVVAGKDDYSGKCNVGIWMGIVAVSCGYNYTMGLKSDGTVVAAGDNKDGQCAVRTWRDIVAIATGYDHSVGLKADGSVVAVGNDRCGTSELSGWKLFKSIDTLEQERAEEKKAALKREQDAEALRRQQEVDAEALRRQQEAEAERQQQIQLERQRRKEEALQIQREAEAEWQRQRQAQIAQLNSERLAILNEISKLKGLFSGSRRKELEARLAQIEKGLKTLE